MYFNLPVTDLLTINYLIKSHNLTEVMVPIHTKNGITYGKRLKNLDKNSTTDFVGSFPHILSSLWKDNNFRKDPPSLLRHNTTKDSVELILDTTRTVVGLRSKNSFKQALSSAISNIPNLDSSKITLFDSKDGKLGIIIPFKSSENNYKQFIVGTDAHKYFGESKDDSTMFGKWFTSLSNKEQLAVFAYTSGGDGYSKLLNTFFRGQKRLKSDETPYYRGKYLQKELKGIQELSTELDSAISKFELPDSIITYRVVDTYSPNNLKNSILDQLLHSFKSGQLFIEKGYCSTTAVKESYETTGDKRIHFKIFLPKGKGIGAWVCPMSEFKNEYEFLLAKGSTFKIKTNMSNIDLSKSDIEIELEYVGKTDFTFETVTQNNTSLIDTKTTGKVKPLDWENLNARLNELGTETTGIDTSNPLLNAYSPNYLDLIGLSNNLLQHYVTKYKKQPSKNDLARNMVIYLKILGKYTDKQISEAVEATMLTSVDPSWLK